MNKQTIILTFKNSILNYKVTNYPHLPQMTKDY